MGTTLRDLVVAVAHRNTFPRVILTHAATITTKRHCPPRPYRVRGYVGMIGSKAEDPDDLRRPPSRRTFLAESPKKFTPFGYNIGSQTVPEICSVSIVAELIACRNMGGTDAAWCGAGRPATDQVEAGAGDRRRRSSPPVWARG